MKNKGISQHRFKQNPKERIFAELWDEINNGVGRVIAVFYGDGMFDNGKNNAEFFIRAVEASEKRLEKILILNNL